MTLGAQNNKPRCSTGIDRCGNHVSGQNLWDHCSEYRPPHNNVLKLIGGDGQKEGNLYVNGKQVCNEKGANVACRMICALSSVSWLYFISSVSLINFFSLTCLFLVTERVISNWP